MTSTKDFAGHPDVRQPVRPGRRRLWSNLAHSSSQPLRSAWYRGQWLHAKHLGLLTLFKSCICGGRDCKCRHHLHVHLKDTLQDHLWHCSFDVFLNIGRRMQLPVNQVGMRAVLLGRMN
jgi:hypothetical protein